MFLGGIIPCFGTKTSRPAEYKFSGTQTKNFASGSLRVMLAFSLKKVSKVTKMYDENNTLKTAYQC